MSGAAPLIGLVLAAHGRLLRVRLSDGSEQLARPARRELAPVCGDRVRCEFDPQHGELRLLDVLARDSALHRTNARGRAELIAANLTRLLVVIAPLPLPDWFLADRYLAAAHCAGIGGCVLLNKSDLADTPEARAELDTQLADFERIGCPVLRVSARESASLDPLRSALAGQRAMLVGQSGVGKSSLLRALAPAADAAVGELVREEEGRHTTSATRLYALPAGGELIDSPGVRDFAPPVQRLEPRALGFAEVETLAARCRFADCRHMQEPGCAVRAATVTGGMSPRRYESYRRLRRLVERLRAEQPP